LAKSFNCETGITSNPCGICDACMAIDAGRFVDYIEMDAASNRGVDEMAQLLEQAVYSPSNARFKVYMIDEVHMLTNHAFNAMLKTLEEPPAHVKFILATTDPQKIPVTVLSRCLQFNLKQMPLPAIIGHLENILAQEDINFELPALRLLAQGAQGSMRDALSLTDQAIAYAAGTVSLEAVQTMLGALDQTYLIKILDALVGQDGAALLAVADQMAARSLSYKSALQDLATLLHQLSIAQLVPAAIATDLPEYAEIMRVAQLIDAEEIQLFYQIAVHGRNELNLAPDEYAGFSMTLLRMLAFRPISSKAASMLSAPTANSKSPSNSTVKKPLALEKLTASKGANPIANLVVTEGVNRQGLSVASFASPSDGAVEAIPATGDRHSAGLAGPVISTSPVKKSPAMAALDALKDRRSTVRRVNNADRVSSAEPNFSTLGSSGVSDPTTILAEKKTDSESELVSFDPPSKPMLSPISFEVKGVYLASGGEWDGNWPKLSASLPLRGMAQQLALQSELFSCEVSPQFLSLGLRVPLETLLASDSLEKLTSVLSTHFTVSVKLVAEIGAVQRTAHAAAIVDRAMHQDAAECAIKSDGVVQGLMREFGATIVPGSIKPVG
jgi:DNA polymerase-3 subunit gamma/tau